jgi:hypothetical protein
MRVVALFEALQRGTFGVELTFPPGVVPDQSAEYSFQFSGPRAGVGWWVFFRRHLALDLSDVAATSLERDIRRHTRRLFEVAFCQRALTPEQLNLGPRTRDPSWCPVVAIERVSIDGGWALHVLNRIFYEPMRETLIGHLLVPTSMGVLEARWITSTNTTGWRESTYVAKRGKELFGADGKFKFPAQTVFDDPNLDHHYPNHPLTVSREARRWLDEGAHMRVLDAPADSGASIDVPEGYRLRPPARVGAPTSHPGPLARPWTMTTLTRASYSVTDGVDRFHVLVERKPRRLFWSGTHRVLEAELRACALGICAEEKLFGVHYDLLEAGEDAGRPTATGVVEGAGPLGEARIVAVGTLIHDHLVALFLETTTGVPIDEIRAELSACARTLERRA